METKKENSENLSRVLPGNTPIPVRDTLTKPYYYVGLLEVTFPNGKKIYGTGTLIAEPGKSESSYVLTSAENLYDEEKGGRLIKCNFLRAYNDPVEPFQVIDWIDAFYPKEYANLTGSIKERARFDFGLVKLRTPVKLDDFQTLSVKTDQELNDLDAQINGYGYFEKRMSHAAGKITGSSESALFYFISAMEESVGSAVMALDNKTIIGIHTSAPGRAGKSENEGLRITEGMKKQTEDWMKI